MEIFGKNSVLEAIKTKQKLTKVYLDKVKYKSIVDLLSKTNIKVYSFEEYKGVTPSNHQKIIATLESYEFVELNKLIENSFNSKTKPVVAVLDKITDPQNVGAIIRNAVAFGISGIIIPKFNQAEVNGTVIKASVGTAFNIDIALTSSLNNVLPKLKKAGFWITSTVMDGDKSLDEIKKLDLPLAIILGSESEGISHSLLEKSDYKLSIPISKNVESLNVSSTSAIIFHFLSSK